MKKHSNNGHSTECNSAARNFANTVYLFENGENADEEDVVLARIALQNAGTNCPECNKEV